MLCDHRYSQVSAVDRHSGILLPGVRRETCR